MDMWKKTLFLKGKCYFWPVSILYSTVELPGLAGDNLLSGVYNSLYARAWWWEKHLILVIWTFLGDTLNFKQQCTCATFRESWNHQNKTFFLFLWHFHKSASHVFWELKFRVSQLLVTGSHKHDELCCEV